MTKDLSDANRVHFIGIGGIGMSAIARLMLGKGKHVTGSDSNRSALTEALEAEGARIMYGHSPKNIRSETELVIYTVAVPSDNLELARAQDLGIPLMTYAEALGHISRGMYTIAISGTHGKTTTTAMIGKIMQEAGFDPTIVVGSLIKDKKGIMTNFFEGTGKYFVTEACEYKRSFLNLRPTLLVITNIENDHLDYYKNLADIQGAFAELASRVPENGALICNMQDPNIDPVLSAAQCKIIDYEAYRHTPLLIPGRHNQRNAQAAGSAAHFLGVSTDSISKSLTDFNGVWRRFEYKGATHEGARVYDDYAHHPTEIMATLESARSIFPEKKIAVVFQPHLFSRTKNFLKEFQEALSLADDIILAPIYPAREEPDSSISHEILAQGITARRVQALNGQDEIVSYAHDHYGSDHVIVIMGAGDIATITPKFFE